MDTNDDDGKSNNNMEPDAFHKDLAFTGFLIGRNDLTIDDITDGFVLLQLLSLVSPSAVDLEWYTTDAAMTCADLPQHNHDMLVRAIRSIRSQQKTPTGSSSPLLQKISPEIVSAISDITDHDLSDVRNGHVDAAVKILDAVCRAYQSTLHHSTRQSSQPTRGHHNTTFRQKRYSNQIHTGGIDSTSSKTKFVVVADYSGDNKGNAVSHHDANTSSDDQNGSTEANDCHVDPNPNNATISNAENHFIDTDNKQEEDDDEDDPERYIPADPTFRPLVRWLLTKTTDMLVLRGVATTSRLFTDLDAALTELDDITRIDIPPRVLSILCDVRLYGTLTRMLFDTDHVPHDNDDIETRTIDNDMSFLQTLMQHGYLNIQHSFLTSLSGMITDQTPFYESVHTNLITAFLSATTRHTHIDHITKHLSRCFQSFDTMNMYPFDMEDAMLMWVNHCVSLAKTRYRVVNDVFGGLGGSVLDMDELDDVGKDLHDGRALCVVVMVYFHEHANAPVCWKLPQTTETCMKNWTLFETLARESLHMEKLPWRALDVCAVDRHYRSMSNRSISNVNVDQNSEVTSSSSSEGTNAAVMCALYVALLVEVFCVCRDRVPIGAQINTTTTTITTTTSKNTNVDDNRVGDGGLQQTPVKHVRRVVKSKAKLRDRPVSTKPATPPTSTHKQDLDIPVASVDTRRVSPVQKETTLEKIKRGETDSVAQSTISITNAVINTHDPVDQATRPNDENSDTPIIETTPSVNSSDKEPTPIQAAKDVSSTPTHENITGKQVKIFKKPRNRSRKSADNETPVSVISEQDIIVSQEHVHEDPVAVQANLEIQDKPDIVMAISTAEPAKRTISPFLPAIGATYHKEQSKPTHKSDSASRTRQRQTRTEPSRKHDKTENMTDSLFPPPQHRASRSASVINKLPSIFATESTLVNTDIHPSTYPSDVSKKHQHRGVPASQDSAIHLPLISHATTIVSATHTPPIQTRSSARAHHTQNSSTPTHVPVPQNNRVQHHSFELDVDDHDDGVSPEIDGIHIEPHMKTMLMDTKTENWDDRERSSGEGLVKNDPRYLTHNDDDNENNNDDDGDKYDNDETGNDQVYDIMMLYECQDEPDVDCDHQKLQSSHHLTKDEINQDLCDNNHDVFSESSSISEAVSVPELSASWSQPKPVSSSRVSSGKSRSGSTGVTEPTTNYPPPAALPSTMDDFTDSDGSDADTPPSLSLRKGNMCSSRQSQITYSSNDNDNVTEDVHVSAVSTTQLVNHRVSRSRPSSGLIPYPLPETDTVDTNVANTSTHDHDQHTNAAETCNKDFSAEEKWDRLQKSKGFSSQGIEAARRKSDKMTTRQRGAAATTSEPPATTVPPKLEHVQKLRAERDDERGRQKQEREQARELLRRENAEAQMRRLDERAKQRHATRVAETRQQQHQQPSVSLPKIPGSYAAAAPKSSDVLPSQQVTALVAKPPSSSVVTKPNPSRRRPPPSKTQSNRALIKNALMHVCLAGTANEATKQEVIEDLDESPASHFVILFREANNFSFRGLYSWDPTLDQTLKVYAGSMGPHVLDASHILEFYKYDSGARTFRPVPTKSFGRSVHAVAIGREYIINSSPLGVGHGGATSSDVARAAEHPRA